MNAARSIRRLFLTGLVVLHGVPAAAVAPPPPAAGPRITIEKELVDVGEVVRGATATATFVVKNTGSETLKILSAKPG